MGITGDRRRTEPYTYLISLREMPIDVCLSGSSGLLGPSSTIMSLLTLNVVCR
jgi:hypothetical protein